MNPIRKFLGKLFNFKQPAKVVTPKDRHFTVPNSQPAYLEGQQFYPRKKSSKPHRTGFGTFTRLKHICGHPVRPFTSAQKRDLSKLWGYKVL